MYCPCFAHADAFQGQQLCSHECLCFFIMTAALLEINLEVLTVQNVNSTSELQHLPYLANKIPRGETVMQVLALS